MNRSSALQQPGELDRPASPSGYSTKDVAALLGLSADQVRSYVRAGFLAPVQGPRGEYYFSFQDLILLRTAKGLLAARVPRRRVRLALQNLREQLPDDRPLTGVRISAQGHHVVVRDGPTVWNPESGQILLDFQVADLLWLDGHSTVDLPYRDRRSLLEGLGFDDAPVWTTSPLPVSELDTMLRIADAKGVTVSDPDLRRTMVDLMEKAIAEVKASG